ncbi:MAG TPA: ammonia-forming cytochrome c nitrite reductase subunit c552, partial [Symbiobacteriaceae bacterium]|nr:ammonia-forming cytochrome c nitrite reductase subunit c552 [Symbiobacteriaceae bacterium]
CVACHDPHNSAQPGQLRMEPEQLCVACHNGSIAEGGTATAGSTVHHPMKEMLAGYGAIGVAPTKGAHTELTCIECHMTEGNHLMKIITPEDIMALGNTTRKDTCTSCHANSNAESRALYLDMWAGAINIRLEAAKTDIAFVDAVLKARPDAVTGELLDKYKAAKTNLTFVEADGSGGAHNFDYAIKIVTTAAKDVAAVRASIK